MKTFDFLLPKPATLIPQSGGLRITSAFTLGVDGDQGRRTLSAASRFLSRLAAKTGLFLSNNKPLINPGNHDCSLLLSCQRQGDLVLNEDESYRIDVGEKNALLSAETDLGLLRGLETMLQLLRADQDGPFFPAVHIEDQPRFPWRGLLIDCARHFQPVDVIKRNLDGMAAVKLNVFHWHLTDDQGFRVECMTFPRLHEFGSNGQYYTQEQIREVISYADQRGIRVVPEFDLPGHTSSWVVGYPELASAPGPYCLETGFGVMDTVLNPIREETYHFLTAFFQEMACLFPDPYIHIGGDENNGKQWLANPVIKGFMEAKQLPSPYDLQKYFNQRLSTILTKQQKNMIGWDEILAPGLPPTTIIQSWRGKESLWQTAQLGYKGILSHGYYLDLMQPAAFHYQNDPLASAPALSAEQSQNILGGEAAIWTEFVSPETIDARIWPRTAAIAERLWSPSTHCTLEHLDERLEVASLRLEELGLTHEKNYPMMLRRLCGSMEISALQSLVDLCEPVKNYERFTQCPGATTTTPLTRVVDVVRTEAKQANKFRHLVQTYLASVKQDLPSKPTPQEKKGLLLCNELKEQLTRWQKNHEVLSPVIKSAPLLAEIHSLSVDLSRIAGLGLEALGYLKKWQKKEPINPEPHFYQRQKEAFAAAKKPRGQVELMVVSAIEELVENIWKIISADPTRDNQV